jgi:hypothetical protein
VCRRYRDALREGIRAVVGHRHGTAGIAFNGRVSVEEPEKAQTDLVKDMIVGYNGEDVRPRCDVCTVGGVGASASCIPVFFTTWGTRAKPHAHDKSTVSGDGARSYGVVQDNFCLSELVAV